MEDLLQRCRMNPRWASEQIAALREIVWLYADTVVMTQEHADFVRNSKPAGEQEAPCPGS